VDVRFVTSVADLEDRPLPVLPEFVFLGRSNCGKSSLINHFFNRTHLARTSRQPGKTQLLNYFLVDNRYYVVDLPGYGFARVSKQKRTEWTRLMRAYLRVQDRPKAIFHLLDVRHQPSEEDLEISKLLQTTGHPLAIAVTKIDKVSKSRLPQRYREIISALDVSRTTPFFATSALKRMGREEMIGWVEALLAAAEAEEP
jgi:GTP-binding protein